MDVAPLKRTKLCHWSETSNLFWPPSSAQNKFVLVVLSVPAKSCSSDNIPENSKTMSELEKAWNEKWKAQLALAISDFENLMLQAEAQLTLIALIRSQIKPPK